MKGNRGRMITNRSRSVECNSVSGTIQPARDRMATERKPELVQLFEHRWLTIDWAIARLTVPLQDIAARNGLVVENWDEDGLGPTAGCGGRLHSGLVIQLVERTHVVAHFKARGPDLYADATDVGRVGIEVLLAEALAALGLNPSDVDWKNVPPTAEQVAAFAKLAEERRQHASSIAKPSPRSCCLPSIRHARACTNKNAASRGRRRFALIMTSKEEFHCPLQAWQRPTLPGLEP